MCHWQHAWLHGCAQVFVDEIACIGCGKCVRQCPMAFEIEASKYGRARVISQSAATPEEVQVAMEVCPVDCIHWVRYYCVCCKWFVMVASPTDLPAHVDP